MSLYHRCFSGAVLERLAVAVITAVCAIVVGQVWEQGGWIQPELIDSSYRIWQLPAANLPARIWLGILDYGALRDRARIISYVAEVVDAVLRPSLVPIVGFNPSLTVVGLGTAIACPLLLYALLRAWCLRPLPATAVVVLFVLSSGFLSVLVCYVRPAKRVAMVAILATLLLGRRYEQRPTPWRFVLMVGALFIGFFVDEACLPSYVVVPLLTWSGFVQLRRWQWAMYLGLPLVFVLVAFWGLPALFASVGAASPIDLSDDPTYGLRPPPVDALFTWLFQADWLLLIARSILTTFGIRPLGIWRELILAPLVLLASFILAWWASRRPAARSAAIGLAVATAALILEQGFAEWLNYVPSRVQAMGRAQMFSFNYYYDSWAVIFVVLWAAAFWRLLIVLGPDRRRWIEMAGCVLIVLASVSSVRLFVDVNQQEQIFHYFPYDQRDVLHQIALHADDLAARTPTVLTIVSDEAAAHAAYEASWQRIMGDGPIRWIGLERLIFPRPGGPPDTLDRLSRLVWIYYPHAPVRLNVIGARTD